MEKCIFCEIVGKRTPAFVVYEDDKFLAFLDINPLNPGHTLVIPKEHTRWTYEVENFGEYWEVAKSVALAAIDALSPNFVSFMTVGLESGHAHIHVLPRFENDGHAELPVRTNVKKLSKEEMTSTAEKLKAAMANHPPKKAAAPIVQLIQKPEEPKKAEDPKKLEEIDEKRKQYLEYLKREINRG